MTVYSLFRDTAFGPEETKVMAEAYERTIKKLHLADRSDPITLIVARKIIRIVGIHERDPKHICDLAMKELAPLKNK